MRKTNEEDFRFLAENSADMVCRVGFDLIMHYASPTCERLLGWRPEEMVGKGPDTFVFPDDLHTVAAAHETLMLNGEDPTPTEVRLRKKNGDYIWMEINARMVPQDGNREASGIVLIMRDISQRKLKELQDGQTTPVSVGDVPVAASGHQHGRTQFGNDLRFRKAFAMTPTPMIIAKLTGLRIIDANDAFAAATGYTSYELVGRGAAEMRLMDDLTCRRVEATLQKEDSLVAMEIRLRTKDCAVRDCLLSIETTGDDGERYVLAMFQDVSERKRSEAELMEAIESVMKDASWFSRAVVEKLAQLRRPHRTDRADDIGLSDLTSREREVLGLICEGRTDDDISGIFGLSRNTVRNHVSRIYAKIGVHRRASAIVWARERGVMHYEAPRKQPGRYR